MKIPFHNRWTGALLCEIAIPDDTEKELRVKVALEKAVKAGAKLTGAILTRADLTSADLTGANLGGAKLAYAKLADADLTAAKLAGANLARAKLARAKLAYADLTGDILTGAILTRAQLIDADLTGAILSYADLTGADLAGAILTEADLTYANLTGAILTGANLTPIREDIYDILRQAVPEVPALLAALREGRIDGSTYAGECACLSGTIAKARGVDFTTLPFKNSRRPAERWFLAIRQGDTPATNPIAAITEKWIVDFMDEAGIPA